MQLRKVEHFFKFGLFEDALREINKEIKETTSIKLLKAFILFNQSQFKDALRLVDLVLSEESDNIELIDEFIARIIRANLMFFLIQWRSSFIEVNNAENLIEKITPTILEGEKLWVAELNIIKGLLTEVLFGELDLAINVEHQAYDLFSEIGDYRGMARALNVTSSLYFFEGFLGKSKKLAEEALALSENKEIKIEILHSLIRIGDYYFSIGNLDEAQKIIQKGLKIIQEIKVKWWESELRLLLGKVYYRQGDFQNSQEEIQHSIQLAKDVGDQHLIAKAILILGDVFQIHGDVHGAIEKFHQSFRIFRGLKDSNCSIDTNLKLGKAYMLLGESNLAYEQFKNSFIHRLWNRLDNKPTNEIPLHAFAYPETLFQLVLVTLELELIDEANEYLNRLEKFHARETNTFIMFQTKLARALILKRNNRLTKKIEAQKILNHLVYKKIVDHSLTIIAILNYCDMLVDELKISGEKEVLTEIETLFQKLINLGRKKNAPIVEIDALLLSSKVSLIEGDDEKAINFLQQAQNTVETKGLFYLLPKIIQHRNTLDKGKISDFKKNDLKKRLEGVQLQDYILETLKATFIQDLGRQSFPLSKMNLYEKYQLVYRDFLKEQDANQRSKCRVGIAQIGVTTQSDLLSEFYEKDDVGLLGLKKDKVSFVRIKVKKMIEEAHTNGVDILIFPELSIDLNYTQFLDDILRYATQYHMYIIPGSFHKKDTKRNVSYVITPNGILWEQEKHIPATITYSGKRFSEPIDVESGSRQTIIGNTEYGRIVVVICRDFLDMDLRVELKNFDPPIDIIFNLSFTPVTADFKAAHFDARRSIYAYCFFVNIGEFGDSSIYTPEKERIERKIESGKEGIIYKDVNLFQLRSERKLWEKKRKFEDKFIQSTK